jgi:hypothetical protein
MTGTAGYPLASLARSYCGISGFQPRLTALRLTDDSPADFPAGDGLRASSLIYCDDHSGLENDPIPDSCRYRPQPDTQATDDHEHQAAGGEIVAASQHIFQNLKHISLLTGASRSWFGRRIYLC